jgi:outer membrane lipase/esterase
MDKATKKLTSSIVLALFFSSSAIGQSYTNMIFFGDSNTDNGRYRYVPQYTTGSSAGVLATTGIYTTPGGFMWSVYLGSRYGIGVSPTVAPGGGNNYAAGNAHVAYSGDSVIGENAWSTAQQITSYLNSVNGRADPNTLYTLYIGTNDLKTPASGLSGTSNIVDPQNISGLNTLASQTISQAQQLTNAGARYLLVPNIASTTKTQEAATAANFPWSQTWADSLSYYNSKVWNGLASQGINFIPADFATVGDYVLLSPTRFGITVTSVSTPACGAVAAINCTSGDLVNPNAMNTYFFADTTGHLSSAGQKIQADYVYGLLTAPGQVSMLANQAALSQITLNNSYLDQVNYSFRSRAPKTLGAWVLGASQQISLNGNQVNSSGSPYSGTAGMDYQYNENLLIGALVGYGQSQVNYNTSGNFTQSSSTLGIYGAYQQNNIWVNSVLSYGWLTNNVNRITPIGVTSFSNASNVNGSNTSFSLQTGYNFRHQQVSHGPVLGYAYINTGINGFTESGNFNSLQFASQTINSSIISAGYQVNANFDKWLPFAKVVYYSQLQNTDRNITTTLTSVSAPSYVMPAISYGDSWTNLLAGIGYEIDPKTTIRASFSQQFGWQNVNSYSFNVGLNAFF